MQQKSLKKNAFYSFLKSFMTLAFPLITFPYASRVLMPEGIGKVNFANSIISYFLMISMLGIHAYGVREVSKLRNNRLLLSKFCQEMLIINFFSTLFSYLLLFIVIFTVHNFSDYRFLLCLASINIVLTTLGMDWLYIAEEDFRYITIRSFFFQLISLFYLFFFVKTPSDINHYMIFGLISSCGSNICNFLHIHKYINFKKTYKLEIKKHFKFIFTFFGISVITSIYTILDTTMLGFLAGNTSVGYYTAATKINKMTLGLLTSIISILLPRFTYYIENHNTNNFIILIQKTFCIMTLLSFPCAVGICLLSTPLILVFSGDTYLPSVFPMQILSILIIILSISHLIGAQILPAIGKEKSALLAYSLGASANIILNMIFIPLYSVTGAAIASVIAEFVVVCTEIVILKKTNRFSVNYKVVIKNILQSIIATIIMGLCVVFSLYFFSTPFLQLFCSFLIGIIAYSIALYILKNTYFIDTLQNIKKHSLFYTK